MNLPVPIKNRVIIQRDTKTESTYLSSFGIWIYEDKPQPKFIGTIISLPDVLTVNEGTEELKVGTRVMFEPHVSIDFEHNDTEYVSVRFIDIMAILEEN